MELERCNARLTGQVADITAKFERLRKNAVWDDLRDAKQLQADLEHQLRNANQKNEILEAKIWAAEQRYNDAIGRLRAEKESLNRIIADQHAQLVEVLQIDGTHKSIT